MNTLFIDTTNNKEVLISLTIDKTVFEIKQEISFNRGQVTLPLIEKLLKDHGLTTKDLQKIEVNAGPGSFTGVRVGVAIANALSFALNIPVNGITYKENGTLVDPQY